MKKVYKGLEGNAENGIVVAIHQHGDGEISLEIDTLNRGYFAIVPEIIGNNTIDDFLMFATFCGKEPNMRDIINGVDANVTLIKNAWGMFELEADGKRWQVHDLSYYYFDEEEVDNEDEEE